MIGVDKVSVRFGHTLALKNVTLHIAPGTIHALAGENGSGKSTLLKVLGGVVLPTEGTVIMDGKPIVLKSVREAIERGIGLVFQELSLFPHLSGFANIGIGKEPHRGGFINNRELQRSIEEVIQRVDFPQVDLTRPVGSLSIAEQQMVEILKCLFRSPSVILFDEPTASLTRRESSALIRTMKQLRDTGYTIAFVSHHLDEVFELADWVSVLRDGELVLSSAVSNTDQDQLLQAMLGKPLTDFYPSRHGAPSSHVGLRLKRVAAERLEPVDLDVYEGEVLGIAGTVGSGANILADVMAGWKLALRGTISVGEREVRMHGPADALRAGIGYVPEDRRDEALFPGLSVSTNGTLPLVSKSKSPLVRRGGILRKLEEQRSAGELVKQLRVRPLSTTTAVDNLSGGNQQKVVMGRWLLRDVPCLILNNPTKGIDVGAKHDVYEHVMALADSGHTIVFVSTYNAELLGVADRIAVMFKGKLLGPFMRAELDEERLLRLTMTGSTDSVGDPLSFEGGHYGT
ncbi:MAG: D-xylose ABC transporter ATP-binding protein [Sulfobacillus acidophilus]|uniref:D-xylose ABC transporter ATP-binding protein n=1 Tax=Sulfobacillus acidophilus TaxID=53633 RepID=A0A2T2WCH7_9FIRM|nr:MAG: D-xylose ABC transporter ATP-binding protein [Sulfobacillus acidophilus]